jgi:hypothetical protein
LAGPEQPEGAPDDLEQRMLEEIARLRLRDLLAQAMLSVSSVTSARLGLSPETEALRDMQEARLGIEALRALLPVLEPELEPAERDGLRQAVARLQMAYAETVQPGEAPPRSAEQAEGPPSEPPPQPRPRIWTPGGDV